LFKCLRQGEDTTSEAFSQLNPYKNRDHIFKDKFFRLHAKRPSKTITAHMYYDCHMYIHPTQHRGLTPREAARVQGFPDQYIFVGKPNEWYRQIGNSVSPLVARVVARAVLSAIKNIF
jgi:DNA (cytosine-5)-methyltransferase 1